MPTRTWTDDDFRAAVASSTTIAGVLRELGLLGGSKTVHRHIERLGLDTSHFTMMGRCEGHGKKSLEEILVENSTFNRSHLKARLLNAGILENRCAICNQDGEWEGKSLTMVLDHINGVNNDHRLENLRMLCPNCNSQQTTFSRGIRPPARTKGSCEDCGAEISLRGTRCYSCASKSRHNNPGRSAARCRNQL